MASRRASGTIPSTLLPSQSHAQDAKHVAPILRLPADLLHYLLMLSCSPSPSPPKTQCTCFPSYTDNSSPPSQPWLTYASLLSLQLTHPSFNRLLTPAFLAQLRHLLVTRYIALENYTHAQWLASLSPHARWLRTYDAWFNRPCSQLRCYRCLEVKPLQGFTNRHASNGLGLGGGQAQRRWCKRCLVEGGRVEWGKWERENWVERKDLDVSRGRQRRRSRRLKWPFDYRRLEMQTGTSPVTDEAKSGICSRCHLTPYELWWGCAGCFENEERRRQDQDRKEAGKMGSGLLGTLQAVGKAKSKWKKIRGPSRQRQWVWIWEPEFWSQLKDFSENLMRKNSSHASVLAEQLDSAQASPSTSSAQRPEEWVEWRPTLSKDETHGSGGSGSGRGSNGHSRREIRCAACWIPNCPRRRWVLGLAYERALPKDRWCAACTQEQQAAQRQRSRARRRRRGGKGKGVVGDDATAASASAFPSTDSTEQLGLDLLFGSG